MTQRRLRHPLRGFGRITGIALLATLVLLLWLGLKLARGGKNPPARAAEVECRHQLRANGMTGAAQAPDFASNRAAIDCASNETGV